MMFKNRLSHYEYGFLSQMTLHLRSKCPNIKIKNLLLSSLLLCFDHRYLMGNFSLNTRQKVTVICLGLANTLGFMALALMGPIYPIIVSTIILILLIS